MSKAPKKVGRPPANLTEYFAKIQPYLQLGFSIHKSCTQADIPYRTVMDYYNDDEDFRRKIDRERSDMVVISRKKLQEKIIKDDFSDSHKYVLDNLDEDFAKNKATTNVQVNVPVFNVMSEEAKNQLEKLYEGSDSTND